MPIVKKTRGKGITKENDYRVVPGPNGYTDEETEQSKRYMSQVMTDGLEKTLAGTEAIVQRRLIKAGLPSMPGFYCYDRVGNWRAISADEPVGAWSLPGVTWRLLSVAEAHGFEFDSPEGYAAGIVYCITRIRTSFKKGHAEEACLDCIRLGQLIAEANLKQIIARGGNKGAKSRWGGEKSDQRKARDEKIRRLHAEAVAGGMSKGQADLHVARKVKVSVRSVQRARCRNES